MTFSRCRKFGKSLAGAPIAAFALPETFDHSVASRFQLLTWFFKRLRNDALMSEDGVLRVCTLTMERIE
ncbi:MAG: hypothetical protein OXC72_12335 [Roseovarius sp.]|nr:hypothetical protein [Roseovarius sp.]MCY4292527.1 hypothetical protein [Roseovarius sp.]MCY4315009.1 hypothetical protein [Roseovarius sp.]